MELQHLHILLDNMRGCTVLLVSDQLLVGLHDVSQLVSQVILCMPYTINITRAKWIKACDMESSMSPYFSLFFQRKTKEERKDGTQSKDCQLFLEGQGNTGE